MNSLVKLAAHDLVFPKQHHQPEIGPLPKEPLGYLIGKPYCLDSVHLDRVGTVFTIHRTAPNILVFRNFYFALLQLLRRTCVFLTCSLIGQTRTYLIQPCIVSALSGQWTWENGGTKRGGLKPHVTANCIQSPRQFILCGLRKVMSLNNHKHKPHKPKPFFLRSV